MTMARDTIDSVLTVTSPLIHTDERVEVMQRFRREPFWLDGELLEIPVYSGNAIRGMLRRACALRICDLLGVTDRSLPVETFYLLFSGGYLSGSDYAYRVAEIQSARTLMPHLALLGCSWGSRVMHGLLDVWRAEPVCAELAQTPAHAGHPAYEDGAPVPSVFDLLTEVSYTRRDDRADQLTGDDEHGGKSPVQMRYSYEALVPGTRLLHGFVLRSTDELVVGALADALTTCTDWQTLGGRAAIGHGRFRWTAEEWAAGHAQAAAAYREHIVAHADEVRTLLEIVPAAEVA